ncbi:MAG TPA: polysaccharide deacetylase family protein [Bryobacteraceae bacterium]|jgi:peptidoglycan/xylan/chitin deacetylase (PgdA/CDA1 family)|nr:polysaccharide deacetylase family protein [Bryobacteraceae bacterium]
MNRTWIKARYAAALSRTGIGRMMGGRQAQPIVVGYHRVVEDFDAAAETSIPSLLITTRTLERHLDWMGRHYRFVDLDELGRRMESGESGGRPVAAITFDDGYRDFHDVALPLLKRKGIPAALFVVTDHVGTARPQAHDSLYLLLARRIARVMENGPGILRRFGGVRLPDVASLGPYQSTRVLLETLPLAAVERVIEALEAEDPLSPNMLESFRPVTWEMLAECHRAGVMIGSHTRTHILMPNETDARANHEALASREELEGRLGIAVRHFAYPSGIFNARSVAAVAAAGYRFGYTTCGHRSPEHPMLTLPRTILWENACVDERREFSESILSCQVRHAFDFVSGCRQRHAFGESPAEV